VPVQPHLPAYQPNGDKLPLAEVPMAEVLRTGEPVRNCELVVERPDGTRIAILANINPLFGPDGQLVGAVNCFQDISERKRAEERLHESERRLRDLLDALPAAIYTTDAEGRITFYNKAAAELAGRRPELGKDQWCVTWRLHRPDGTPMAHDECPMAVALKENRPVRETEAIAERPDGAHVPFIPYPTPLRDASGRLVGAVNMLVDISERKRAEEEIRRLNETLEQKVGERTRQLVESEARLRTYFEHSPDWMVLQQVMPDGRLFYADINPACEAGYGMPRAAVIGRSFDDILGAEPARPANAAARACIETGRPQSYVARRTIGGRTRTIDVLAVPLPGVGPAGERHVLMTARDITERETLEAQLRQSQKMEALGQLTGGVAHDFNNLLASVLGNLELIEMRAEDDATRRLTAAAIRSAERGAELTRQLLAFSRKQHLATATVDLRRLVKGMRDMLRRTLGGTVEVRTELAVGLWPATVDATQAELCILNLAINARDAMPLGGTLTIEARNMRAAELDASLALKPGDYVRISVADTGCGMSDALAERAFEPFFTTKEPGKGSGLGLSQVYGVARQSGGAARILSRPGAGTTVEVYLPRSLAEERQDAPPSATPRRATEARVLVVDDQDDVRAVAVEFLETLGYQTIDAASPREALRLVETDAVDLVLADYAMAEMSGIDLAEAVAKLRPRTRTVLMTGYADMDALLDRFEETLIIGKPFRLQELSAKVELALARRPGADRQGADGRRKVIPLAKAAPR
jgi:PAS domain S-box-containing protein